jgi:hypothetical protein
MALCPICAPCLLVAAIPSGAFLFQPGQVALCPKGTYAVTTDGDRTKCQACGEGITTPAVGSTSQTACNLPMPGYYAKTVANGRITVASKCPQKM